MRNPTRGKIMRRIIILLSTLLLALVITGAAAMANGNAAGSLGKITVGTDVSEWDVGSGQQNGQFVVSEVQGIELGL
jgi:hypothetical protein